MRRLLLFATIALTVIGLIRAEELDGPRLRFEKKTVDLGRIERGEVASDTVRFINAGEQPLVIQRIHTDCGCTTADYTREPVGSGESGYIVVSFNSKNYEAGKFHKSVRIKSNALNYREIIYVEGVVTVNIKEE